MDVIAYARARIHARRPADEVIITACNRIGNANFGNGHIPPCKRTKERWLVRCESASRSAYMRVRVIREPSEMTLSFAQYIHTQLYYYIVIASVRYAGKKYHLYTTQLLARRYHRFNNRLIDPRRSNCFAKLIQCIKVMDARWRSLGFCRPGDYLHVSNASDYMHVRRTHRPCLRK